MITHYAQAIPNSVQVEDIIRIMWWSDLYMLRQVYEAELGVKDSVSNCVEAGYGFVAELRVRD